MTVDNSFSLWGATFPYYAHLPLPAPKPFPNRHSLEILSCRFSLMVVSFIAELWRKLGIAVTTENTASSDFIHVFVHGSQLYFRLPHSNQ